MARLVRMSLLCAVITVTWACHFGDTRGNSIIMNTTTQSLKVRYTSEGQVGFVYDLPPGAVGRAEEVLYPGGYKLEVLTADCEVLGSLSLQPGENFTAVGDGGLPRPTVREAIPDESVNEELLILGETCGSLPSALP